MMTEWFQIRKQEQERVKAFVESFDDSDDKVIQFGEFKEILKKLEPSVNTKQAIKMFKLSSDEEEDGLDIQKMVELITRFKMGGFGNFVFADYIEKQRDVYNEHRKMINRK